VKHVVLGRGRRVAAAHNAQRVDELLAVADRVVFVSVERIVQDVGRLYTMNEARLSHLPFWGPSEAIFFLIKRPSG